MLVGFRVPMRQHDDRFFSGFRLEDRALGREPLRVDDVVLGIRRVDGGREPQPVSLEPEVQRRPVSEKFLATLDGGLVEDPQPGFVIMAVAMV